MDPNIISSASWPNSQATNATVRGSSALTTSSSKHLSQNKRILQLLEGLQPNRLSLLTILIKVLDPSEKDLSAYCNHFYACPKGSPIRKLNKLFDQIFDNP
ncbi:hypothetical protein PAXRUDRAFT_147142, partial [Paxillus rubicundulus Ve08.2h10]